MAKPSFTKPPFVNTRRRRLRARALKASQSRRRLRTGRRRENTRGSENVGNYWKRSDTRGKIFFALPFAEGILQRYFLFVVILVLPVASFGFLCQESGQRIPSKRSLQEKEYSRAPPEEGLIKGGGLFFSACTVIVGLISRPCAYYYDYYYCYYSYSEIWWNTVWTLLDFFWPQMDWRGSRITGIGRKKRGALHQV